MLCRVTTRRILEKSDVVKDCKYLLHNAVPGLYNAGSKYDCKIALNKRRMNRCRNCYFSPLKYL